MSPVILLKLQAFGRGAARAFSHVVMPSSLEACGVCAEAHAVDSAHPAPGQGLLEPGGAAAEALESLRHSARGAAARLHALSQGVAAGVLFLGREGRVDLVNRALCRMLGVASAAELVGQPGAAVAHQLSDRFADPDAFTLQGFGDGAHRLVLADGRILSRELVPVGLEGEPHGVLVLLREVSTPALSAAGQLEPLLTVTLVDELTGLLNRRGFLAQASRRLRRAVQEHRPASLFCLDVDGMKTINDRLGHSAGDQALQEAAALLRHVFCDADLLARLGGDEFAVLSLDISETQHADVVERVLREIALLNARPARAWRLSLSIGAASFHAAQTPLVEELLAVADARLYAQKRVRKGTRD
jgi:diguanylate cyclase (GGDEF)-like protein